MKFTLSWLRTHLDTDADAATIGETLTRIGLELESIENRADALRPFRIARVIEAAPHPDADRLRACRVDAGDGVPVSVVCGAPNARTGMIGVFAPPGSFIPGTNVTLKVGKIRGVESAGMLLSAREMGLGEDHSGIVDLPADAPVGTPYAAWAGLDDPLFDIAVTPNRGDALSVHGVARDLAAAGLGTLRPWVARTVPASFASPLRWAIRAEAACPYVLGRALRGLRNGPSPQWLQDRLKAIGLRPINALVDVTNFFTFDLGRPLHVFDLAKVHGNTLTMEWGDGTAFRALNGKDFSPTEQDCVIRDTAGIEGLGGVIGGEASGCNETTTSAFIECAWFDPVRIARTGQRHGIATDARARFERGIDIALMPEAIEAAAAMMIELCGGEASEVVQAGAPPPWQRDATLRFARLRELGGHDVPAEQAEAMLNRLGFATRSRDAAHITVSVPSWRNDIAAATPLDQATDLPPDRASAAARRRDAVEAECDLIEEVLRLVGLDAVPPVSMPVDSPVPRATLSAKQARAMLARRMLAARGYLDCVTFSFTDRATARLFAPADVLARWEQAETLAVANPIASDLDHMRATPLATLAQAAARNAARGYADVALAEVGSGLHGTGTDAQFQLAAGLRAGATPRHWQAPARGVDMMDVKADLWALLAALGVPLDALSVAPDPAAAPYLHPGRHGVVRQGPKGPTLATFGELHPRVLASLDLTGPAAAFELFLDRVPEPKRRRKQAPDIPAFQPVARDFAFVVDADVPADAVVRAARGAERTLIERVSLFDRYTGTGLPDGKVSLAIAVTFQPRERTLTDAEIDAACAKVVAAVTKATGAVLR